MITMKDVKKGTEGKPKNLKFITTKSVEAKYLDKEGPPVPTKISVSTHNIHIVQAEIKRREAKEKQRLDAQAKRDKKKAVAAAKAKKKKAVAEPGPAGGKTK